MADRPMIFSAPMVRALLEGRKTQTRRVLKPQPPKEFVSAVWSDGTMTLRPASLAFTPFYNGLLRLPRPGDRIWVRESGNWRGPMKNEIRGGCFGLTFYAADSKRGHSEFFDDKNRPAIHMPRWASRLTLIVTDVRVQRLQDIETDDCYEEGAKCDMSSRTIVEHFRNLWDSLNARRGYPWEINPWVCALTFDVIRQNIDALPTGSAAGM